tara:strand:- start:1772 stop:3109 length:1338 start_codon:yes stop_codon:yes gene_type:complete
MNNSNEGGLRAPERDPVDWKSEDYWDLEKIDEETRRQFDVCHGCRRCFNLCDSFPKLFDLIDESETFELDSVDSKDFKPVIDACTLCDMCFMVTCPYVPPHEFAIDIPKLMLRHRAVNYKKGKVKFREKIIAEIDRNGKLGTKVKTLSNAITSLKNKPSRYILEKTLDIDKRAKLPKFSKKVKSNLEVNERAPSYGEKAILFSSCYGTYHNTEIIKSANNVLKHNGVDLASFYEGCCGMPQLEQGNIERVAKQAKTIASKLIKYVEKGKKVIAPIPSCALMLKSEWPLISPSDDNIVRLAEATMDIDEYIIYLSEKYGLAEGMKPLDDPNITVHLSCHSKAQNIGPKSAQMLRLIPSSNVKVIERCSGHGGSWGVKKDNFDTALKIGKIPTKNVMKFNSKYFASTCPLAGEHMKQISEIEETKDLSIIQKAYHPIQLLAFSYGFK